ncbi:MAG: hypothetical protein OEW75_18420, partial [Cyclobacteriaceae bacterium]|nr:hypothetical protein [Cyclobacteriaceae bacterium]
MTNKDKKLLKLPWPYRLLRWTFPKVECVSPVLAGKWAARLFFRPFKVPTPKRESVVLNNAERFSEAINGKKVACYKWGEGTPVIMVHGWSGRGTQF